MANSTIGKQGIVFNLLEQYKMFTLTPDFPLVPEHFERFRWRMHLSLPYPFPSKVCVRHSTPILEKTFSFSIHNHYRRVFQALRSAEGKVGYFRVSLEDKRKPPVEKATGTDFTRENLQAVALFEETTEYTSPKEAFARASEKIKACFDYLSTFLSACQRSAPYLTSWLVYPISEFDVGTVYHDVDAFCSKHQRWEPFASAVGVSAGRQLQRPAFVMEVPQSVDIDSPMDLTNELLAEALMSLFRGLPRLTLVNSYTAVESLANVVFSRTKVAKLVSHGMPQEMAEETVEDERKRHRTEGNFLYHRGIKTGTGRSLLEDNKPHYDELLRLQEMRHRVAHTGYKPTADEAREAHKICCEAAIWLAEVAGFPTKPLRPDAASSYPGFSVAFKDAQTISSSEIDLLRFLLNLPPTQSEPTDEPVLPTLPDLAH